MLRRRPHAVFVLAALALVACNKEDGKKPKGKDPTDTATTPSYTETYECPEVTGGGETSAIGDLLLTYGCEFDAGIASGSSYTITTDASVTAAEVWVECPDCTVGGEVHPMTSEAITDGLQWTVALHPTRIPGTYTPGRSTEWLGACGPNKLAQNGATVVIALTTADGTACQSMGCNAQAWADSDGCRPIP